MKHLYALLGLLLLLGGVASAQTTGAVSAGPAPPTIMGGDLSAQQYPGCGKVWLGGPNTYLDMGCSNPGTLTTHGGTSQRFTTIATTPYTIASSDYYIRCNATGQPEVINLPAATGTGRLLLVMKTDVSVNACTVTRAGTDTINGATTDALSTQFTVHGYFDGAPGVWDIVSH